MSSCGLILRQSLNGAPHLLRNLKLPNGLTYTTLRQQPVILSGSVWLEAAFIKVDFMTGGGADIINNLPPMLPVKRSSQIGTSSSILDENSWNCGSFGDSQEIPRRVHVSRQTSTQRPPEGWKQKPEASLVGTWTLWTGSVESFATRSDQSSYQSIKWYGQMGRFDINQG